ncbi:hypothetical protein B484DRAFT_273229, partial [Ochromonadaceae sp. CCMP2298]
DVLATPASEALAEANRPVDALYGLFKFRAALADQFSSALRKNAGKSGSLSFDVRCSPQEAASLFRWPAVQAATAPTLSAGKESNRVSYLVTASTIFTPAVLKNLVVLKLDDPTLLAEFLGRTYRYFPICDLNYRTGGFTDLKFACLVAEPGTLTFSYDLSSDTLFVKAKVEKLSQEQAGALPPSPAEGSSPAASDGSTPPPKKLCT